jgi:predicted dinucleotide-binding enzyme
MARIGFIGLGNMGLPMAQNLIKAGHQVEGVDVNPASLEKLKAAGGASVEFAKVAAARADVVITMLPAGKQVREVYLGPAGIIENANAGTLLIDCSTIDVETARVVAAVAPPTPPDTGASSIVRSFCSAAPATARAVSTSMVEQSTSSVPALAFSMAPDEPR